MIWRRTLKRRFGIAAPRVAVHTHLPWHWRALIFASGALALAALAWLTYDFGLNLGGFHSQQAAEEHARMSADLQRLQDENADLSSQLAALERQMQIEASTKGDLAGQLSALSDENALLKEDLALFQTLMNSSGGDAGTGVTINRFRVRRDGLPGEYRYQLLVVQSRTRSKEFQGRLQLVVDMLQDGQPQVLVLPGNQEKVDPYNLSFRFYQRVEGGFQVPVEAIVTRVQVRVLENGIDGPRSSQSVNLS
jgi:hypothetical protein